MKDTLKTLVSLVGITFLFGMTWLFAIFTFDTTNENVNFALQLLFAFFNSLQGFFIFFFFVVLSSDARQAWQQLLCPCKKKAKPVTSTSNKFAVKSSGAGTAGTLSSALPSYQSSTLEHNLRGYRKQSQELVSFSMTEPIEEIEEEEASSPDLLEPAQPLSREETPPKIPLDQPEEVKEMKLEVPSNVSARVQRRSTKRHTHDIEIVELEFDVCSSEESLDEEDN